MSLVDQGPPTPEPSGYAGGSSGSFDILTFIYGFILGQFSVASILFLVIAFFIFGGPVSQDGLRPSHSSPKSALSHKKSQNFQAPLRAAISTLDILQKTGYDPHTHLPESVDWFNVLISQTLSQIRLDALHRGVAVKSLEKVLNGSSRPSWVSDIKVTEMNLGEAFPIFSNCRIYSVNDATTKEPFGPHSFFSSPQRPSSAQGAIGENTRLQAQIDVELNDVITLAVETKIVLNLPKPFVASLPVALAVSVVRLSGTLLLSLVPVPSDEPGSQSSGTGNDTGTDSPKFTTGSHNSTALTFTFDPSYSLSLKTSSLVGSRARLTDVPKLAQLIELKVRSWFQDRVVYPRFQQVVLPSLWPRMKNARGGDPEKESDEGADENVDKSTWAETASTTQADTFREQAQAPQALTSDHLRWRGQAPPPVP